MSERDSLSRGGYYFALPRFCGRLRGGEAVRSENNSVEAYLGGVAVYLISCVTLIALTRASALFAIAIFSVAWVGWIAVLYVNSVVVRALRSLGMFRGLANPRAQNVIIGVETTACAVALTTQPRWQMLGAIWLLLVGANTAAAILLHVWKPRDA